MDADDADLSSRPVAKLECNNKPAKRSDFVNGCNPNFAAELEEACSAPPYGHLESRVCWRHKIAQPSRANVANVLILGASHNAACLQSCTSHGVAKGLGDNHHGHQENHFAC